MREYFRGYFGDEEVEACFFGAVRVGVSSLLGKLLQSLGVLVAHTDDKALHLILPEHFDAKRSLHILVVLERAAAGRHDAELRRPRAIEFLMLLLQLLDKRDTITDLVGFELEKVQPAAEFLRARLVREVDEFREGATDLFFGRKISWFVRGLLRFVAMNHAR